MQPHTAAQGSCCAAGGPCSSLGSSPRLPQPGSLPRQHHPGSSPAQLAQQVVPRAAGGAAAEQAPDGHRSKHRVGSRGRAAITEGNPLLQSQAPRLGTGLPLDSPCTGKERVWTLCCGLQIPGAQLEEAGSPKQVSLYSPRVASCL